ncbi:MAG: lamin tail domain-containing protein [Patescibacteria group bacterium]
MNTSYIILVAVFLGIISLLSFSIHSGIIEIKKPQNFLGLVGVDNSDDFKFVGSVDLEVNLRNSSSTQDNNYLENNNKKAISAPVKTKKEKEPSQTIVKVISGAALNQKNDASLFSSIVSATTSVASSTASSTIAAILPIEAPAQIQNKISEQISEKILEQIPAKIFEEIPKEIPAQSTEQAPALILEQVQEYIIGNILISEIMAGADGNSSYEFIELFNSTASSVDLTGWSIKKKSSSGSESTLVSSSRFENKIIPPNKYFLLANEGGYDGQISADVFWPKSYTLAYASNAIIIYNSNNELVEEVSWTEISKGQSIEREYFNNNQFKTQSNPNPQNSSL